MRGTSPGPRVKDGGRSPESSPGVRWENSTAGNNVRSLSAMGEVLWVGGSGGLFRLGRETGEKRSYNRANSGLPNNVVYSTAAGARGEVWVGTWGSGVASYDGGRWRIYDVHDSGLPHDNVSSVDISGDGSVWVGTIWNGLARLEPAVAAAVPSGGDGDAAGGDDAWTVFSTANSQLPSDNVLFVTADEIDRVWLGLWGGGLAVLTP